jgi:hypothetical protein
MKKFCFFVVFALIFSMFNIDSSVVMAAQAYGNSYGEQLDDEVSTLFYSSMIDTYIYKEGETGNYDGRYTNLPKRINGDGSILFDYSTNPELFLYKATKDSQSAAEEEVGNWFNTNYKALLVYSSNAMHSFFRDYPQAFWIKGFTAKASLSTSTTYKRSTGYTTTGYMEFKLVPVKNLQPNDYLDEFNESIISLTRTFERQFADYDDATKVKEVHDYIAERVDYNYDAAACTTTEYDYAYTPLAVFVDKSELGNQVVCQGYAKAFKIICDRLGIKNALLTGMASSANDKEYHMWNAVKINNLWYALDITWDDQKSGLVYTYFLVGNNTVTRRDATYKTDHVVENVFGEVNGAKTFLIPEVASKEMNVDYLVKRDNDNTADQQSDNSESDNGKNDESGKNGKTVNIDVIFSKSVTYTGGAVKNALTIKFGDDTLKEGTDYKVTYKNNVNVGNASFSVTFIGKYKNAGSFTKSFQIKKVNLSAVTVSKLKVKKINLKKGKVTLATTVKYGKKTLKNGKDYTMTVKLNKKKGIVQVTFKGKGNYEGKKVAKIKVKK